MNGKGLIKILITGDFCPINRIEDLAVTGDLAPVFNDYINVLRQNDLNVIDLECPLTLSENARVKSGPHQKARPECIGILNYAEVNVAATANNHIMDYGYRGANDTIELCRKYGIETIGTGHSPEEAAKAYSLEVKGKKIAIMNYADDEFISAPDAPFFGNPLDPVRSFYEIKSLKNDHDLVIVIIHAGNEFYELPSPRTKKIYRYLADIGADVIISHHTHAYSGFEIYNSKPIFYGLGNFIYDWPGKINSSWNTGYSVLLKISDEIDFELIPLKQGNEKAGVFHLEPEEKLDFNDNITRLNSIIADETQLEAEFQKYCKSVFSMYEAFIEPGFGTKIASLRKRGFFPKLLSRKKKLLLLNLVRCESHRDVLLRMLKRYE